MTLKELVDSAELTSKNEDYCSLYGLAERAFNEFFSFEHDSVEELKCYFTPANWLCTDTQVGIRIYTFKGEKVAISAQQARKCPEEFEWISKEKYNQVYDFLKSKDVSEKNIHFVPVDWDCDVSSWINETNWHKTLTRH